MIRYPSEHALVDIDLTSYSLSMYLNMCALLELIITNYIEL